MMPARIAILGGGVGGTLAANLLARKLKDQDVQITVADRTGKHVYQPGWLYLPFGAESERNLVRNERSLLDKRVNLIVEDFSRIDMERRLLVAESGAALPFDYLVIATGSRNTPEDVPGLAEGAYHFYSAEAATQLGQALRDFQGGTIVLGVGGLPHRCPPAPLEFLLLLDADLRRSGKRESVNLVYTYPIGRPFTIETVSDFITPVLEERGVTVETFFNPETVDPQQKQILSLEGTTLDYDLLIMIPPHRGAEVISASGIGDEQGWAPTDRHTLAVQGLERVYAIGDATDLPVSKSGSAAHFQAKVVAERIAAEITGKPLDEGAGLYNGHVMCFLETGNEQATTLNFDYDHPPEPPRPSRIYHYEKMLFNRTYWYIVPKGIV
ncbi:MAG: pyridine nucleotide-disulfide oxidoreductase [Chloroflexi bacterium]|nr:MAG: pyridine nucleotide-disulfide oxidoreductase [Chloroflexota bacterium]